REAHHEEETVRERGAVMTSTGRMAQEGLLEDSAAAITLIIDLTQWDLESATRHVEAILRRIVRMDVALIAVVKEVPSAIPDSRVTFVESGSQFGAVERLSLALQMVSSPLCFLSSTAVEFSSEMLE